MKILIGSRALSQYIDIMGELYEVFPEEATKTVYSRKK